MIVHRQTSLRARGGSRSEVSAMGDRRKCRTNAASPAEPGGLPVMLAKPFKSDFLGIVGRARRPGAVQPGTVPADSSWDRFFEHVGKKQRPQAEYDRLAGVGRPWSGAEIPAGSNTATSMPRRYDAI
jgi:hypothetical protein